MSLQKAECKNCGNIFTVDDKLKTAMCEYCGLPCEVREAIKNYNYNYNYFVNNSITADNVIVTGKGDAEKERLLKNAKTNEGLGEYGKAKQIYMLITDDYPGDYRGWLGLALLISENNTKTDLTKAEYDIVCEYMRKALICVPDNKKQKLSKSWEEYKKRYNDFLSYFKLKTDSKISELKNMLNDRKKKEKDISDQIEKYSSDIRNSHNKINNSSEVINSLSKQIEETKKRGDDYDKYNTFAGCSLFFLITISFGGLTFFSNYFPDLSSVLLWFFCVAFVLWIICISVYPKIKKRKYRKIIKNIEMNIEAEQNMSDGEKEKIKNRQEEIERLEKQKNDISMEQESINNAIEDIKIREKIYI